MTNPPNRIWSVPAYLPYLKSKLKDEAVRDAEQTLGVALPPAYLELLRTQNGGCIRYRLEGVPHREIYGIGPDYPSLANVAWDDVREQVAFDLDGLIPFDGDGHWYLCLDYREDSKVPLSKPNEPRITYVDIELDRQSHVATESPRISRRLQKLGEWNHGKAEQVLTGSPGASSKAIEGNASESPLGVGSCGFSGREDRLYTRDVAHLGTASAA